MALSYVEYVANGSQDNFTVTFSFIDRTHVVVSVNGSTLVHPTEYTWLTDSAIKITTMPGIGDNILIQRVTPTTPIIDFKSGQNLNEFSLDTATQQSIKIAEESRESSILRTSPTEDWLADGGRITNVGDPLFSQDAATKVYVDNENNTQDAALADLESRSLLESGGVFTAESKRITNVSDGTTAGDAINKAQLDAAVIGGVTPDAVNINYSNTTSGMTAIDVQAAVDEVEGRVDTLEANAGVGGPPDAVDVTYSNTTSGMTAVNVQAAVDEVEGRVDTLEADPGFSGNASDVTYSNTTSGMTAVNVQAAVDEVEGRVDTLEADPGFSGNASDVTYFNTTSGLTATNVQAAIDEVAGSGGGGGAADIDLYTTAATLNIVAGDHGKTIVVWQDNQRNIQLPDTATLPDRFYLTVVNGNNGNPSYPSSHKWVYVQRTFGDDIVYPNAISTPEPLGAIKIAHRGERVTVVSDKPNGRWVVVEDTRQFWCLAEGGNQSVPNNSWTKWDMTINTLDPYVLIDLSNNWAEAPLSANWCEVNADISTSYSASPTHYACRVAVEGSSINNDPNSFASYGAGITHEEWHSAGGVSNVRYRIRTGAFPVRPLDTVEVQLHQNSGAALSQFGEAGGASNNRAIFRFWS